MTSDSMKPTNMAFVTLVTTDSYSIGAQVLGRSLRKVESRYPLICLVTGNLSASCLKELYNSVASCIDEVRVVEAIDSADNKNLELLGRPELGCTFTKLQVWKQLDLEKIVFLDADMLVLKNIDDLFDRDELSACPDAGWPDCFNSGLFVCRPSNETYLSLTAHAKSFGSFDGGDQGLLNSYFADWAHGDSAKRIPFGYNLTINASYSYLPAFKHFQNEVKIVHFIGYSKPWTFHRFADGKVIPHNQQSQDHLQFIQQWWDLYDNSRAKTKSHDHVISTGTHFQTLPNKLTMPVASSNQDFSSISVKDFNGQSFGNYKISWSNDVEEYFNKMDVSDSKGQSAKPAEIPESKNAIEDKRV